MAGPHRSHDEVRRHGQLTISMQTERRESADPATSTSWLSDHADVGIVVDLLHEVIDPELGVNIVDLGLLYGLHISERVVQVKMTLTTPGCPLGGYIDDEIHRSLSGAPGVDDASVEIVWDPPWGPPMMSDIAKSQLGWRQ